MCTWHVLNILTELIVSYRAVQKHSVLQVSQQQFARNSTSGFVENTMVINQCMLIAYAFQCRLKFTMSLNYLFDFVVCKCLFCFNTYPNYYIDELK